MPFRDIEGFAGRGEVLGCCFSALARDITPGQFAVVMFGTDADLARQCLAAHRLLSQRVTPCPSVDFHPVRGGFRRHLCALTWAQACARRWRRSCARKFVHQWTWLLMSSENRYSGCVEG